MIGNPISSIEPRDVAVGTTSFVGLHNHNVALQKHEIIWIFHSYLVEAESKKYCSVILARSRIRLGNRSAGVL